MKASVQLGDTQIVVDLSSAISVARELDFEDRQPQHFDAPAAMSRPYSVTGFSGSVATGASCNCNVITVIPHCNGTHTECVGHLTREPLDAHRVVPTGLLPALLISVSPVAANSTRETTEPTPQPNDWLITRESLERRWPTPLPFAPQALVIRTRTAAARDAATATPVASTTTAFATATPAASATASIASTRTPTDPPPPYLTYQAAQMLVERGIEHLVIDLPSIDRDHDEGRLSAHRVFFGLPRGENSVSQAHRPQATITEFALIPREAPDGPYLLELQVPAWRGDAVPSRPLLYALQQA